MQTRRNFLKVAASTAFFAFPGPLLNPVRQTRSLEMQLQELSEKVSKSSGIKQNFEHGICDNSDYGGGFQPPASTIANNNPDDYIHIFAFHHERQLMYEMRELRNIRLLVNCKPSDAPGTIIPNPVKAPDRYALVYLKFAFPGLLPINDLTELARIAEQPIDPENRVYHPGFSGFMIFDRKSQRMKDKNGHSVLRHSSGLEKKVYLSAYGEGNWLDIQYNPFWGRENKELDKVFDPERDRQLMKRYSRQELITRLYSKPIVRHDWTSTHRTRMDGLNKLLAGRKYVDLVLRDQNLKLETGMWKATSQNYAIVGVSKKYNKPYINIGFERINDKMVITEVF